MHKARKTQRRPIKKKKEDLEMLGGKEQKGARNQRGKANNELRGMKNGAQGTGNSLLLTLRCYAGVSLNVTP